MEFFNNVSFDDIIKFVVMNVACLIGGGLLLLFTWLFWLQNISKRKSPMITVGLGLAIGGVILSSIMVVLAVLLFFYPAVAVNETSMVRENAKLIHQEVMKNLNTQYPQTATAKFDEKIATLQFALSTRNAEQTQEAKATRDVVATQTMQAIINDERITKKENLYNAVVRIVALYNGQEFWSGSGSIITQDGLILTNAHVALHSREYPVAVAEDVYPKIPLRIDITTNAEEEPKQAYFAEPVQSSRDLDLAVIQITEDINHQPIDKRRLNLPTVKIGDSDALSVGDKITAIGYPSIGGSKVTLTQGEVSGFSAQKDIGDRAWIKTSTTIAGGNSGGLVINQFGEMIGIPTQVGSGEEGADLIDCRIADEANPFCVPIGGFINAIRSINTAITLIDNAKKQIFSNYDFSIGKDIPIKKGAVLYEETFEFKPEENRNWDSKGSTWNLFNTPIFGNGNYHVNIKEPKSYEQATLKIKFKKDIVIKVDSQALATRGDDEYGIFCQSNKTYAKFYIARNGYFNINTPLTNNWIHSSDIPNDLSSVKITASCKDKVFALMINDVTLGYVVVPMKEENENKQETEWFAGIWSKTQYGSLDIVYDNFTVYEAEE